MNCTKLLHMLKTGRLTVVYRHQVAKFSFDILFENPVFNIRDVICRILDDLRRARCSTTSTTGRYFKNLSWSRSNLHGDSLDPSLYL